MPRKGKGSKFKRVDSLQTRKEAATMRLLDNGDGTFTYRNDKPSAPDFSYVSPRESYIRKIQQLKKLEIEMEMSALAQNPPAPPEEAPGYQE